MAAQVVSGIGFLGAGIIFRQGFTVHGLNTAATLWCSAAVGLMAGAHQYLFACISTGMIVFVNLGLRPLVKLLKRKTRAGLPITLDYKVILATAQRSEKDVRLLALRSLAHPGVHVCSLERSSSDGRENVELELMVSVYNQDEAMIDRALQPLLLDPRVDALAWEAALEV